MSPISADAELSEYTLIVYSNARKINELAREGKGFELMKALQRIEIASQLAQKRLTEL